jgi:hypothetical protein
VFFYVLITAELTLLYGVFWYLFLREPTHARRIGAETWGMYPQYKAAMKSGFRTRQNNIAAAQAKYVEVAHEDPARPVILPVYDEMTLDLRTNRYVPVPEKQQTIFGRFIDDLDGQLSTLNIRP